jgi:hypothetical protein
VEIGLSFRRQVVGRLVIDLGGYRLVTRVRLDQSDWLGYSEPVNVAAYQAPLLLAGSMAALELIQEQVAQCERKGISILCCPEGILGGLADYSENPTRFAIRTDDSQLVSTFWGFPACRIY